MRNPDQGTSLFWFGLSIAFCIGSLRLGIGTPGNPGMGFLAFCASTLLAVLSLILFLKTIWKKERTQGELFAGKQWKRVLLVLISLAIYARILPLAGYLIGTFLLMCFIFWIARFRRWWLVPVSSFLTTVITYYFFSVWLNCSFPQGVFGF